MTREEVANGMAQWYRYMYKEALKRSGGDPEHAEEIRSYAVAMGLGRYQSARRETFTTWLMFLIKGATVRLRENRESMSRKHGEMALWMSTGAFGFVEPTDRAAERASVSAAVQDRIRELPNAYKSTIEKAYFDEERENSSRFRFVLLRARSLLRERIKRTAPELIA